MSVCQFCLTFGRERKPLTQPARGGRRRRSPSLKPWTVADFSRARVEELYALSHPKKFTAFQSAVAKDQSASAVRIFFSANKLDAHFDRATEGRSDIFKSYEVGSLLKSLYEMDYDFASEDPEVRCISALELEEVDSSDSDYNCDESNSVRLRDYIATISYRCTFIHVLDLVKIGLSYRQVEAVRSLTSSTIPKAMSMLKPISRQTARVFTRIVAAWDLEALRGVMQRSWEFSVAADASASVHGVAYFSIRMRLVSIDESKSSLHNLHLLTPPLTRSHTGKFMHYLTELVLSALDSHWRAKKIGSTSDGAANMMGIYSGWQVRLLKICQGSGLLYRIHCGPYLLNLVNGRAIAALRKQYHHDLLLVHQRGYYYYRPRVHRRTASSSGEGAVVQTLDNSV
jgi:hypothetical protein